MPFFRADALEKPIWDWIASYLLDPAQMEAGLSAYLEKQEQRLSPVRERLRILSGLIKDKRTQYERLLDVYISGEFPKEIVVKRKSELEAALAELEEERASLEAKLEADVLTPEQVAGLKDFAVRVSEGLQKAGFEDKRKLLELLNLQVWLDVEDGRRVAYAECRLNAGPVDHPAVVTIAERFEL